MRKGRRLSGWGRPGTTTGLVLLFAVVGATALGLLALGIRTGTSPSEVHPDVAEATAGALSTGDAYALWARRPDGTAVRWDPCGTVTWTLSSSAPPDAQHAVAVAFERIAGVTGLNTRFVGTTDEAADVDRAAFQPGRYGTGWAPVLVTWVPPHTNGLPLRDTDRAISIPVAVDGVFVTGQIALNAHQTLDMDFHDRATSWGATLLHEIGHLVGLDHVDDRDQLMYRFAGAGPVRFGAGDLAGLGAVGVSAGSGDCLDAGPPRSVDVRVTARR